MYDDDYIFINLVQNWFRKAEIFFVFLHIRRIRRVYFVCKAVLTLNMVFFNAQIKQPISTVSNTTYSL
jgi:hypothetical protein